MKRRTLFVGAVSLLIASALWASSAVSAWVPMDADGFTSEFNLRECRFSNRGRNQFFNLEPGYQLRLAGEEEGQPVELTITVLDRSRDVTLMIDGRRTRIRTRVIEERETVGGELKEVSRNYYARDTRTGDIFYFGEDVCFYEDGECVSTDGSWLAGVNGATPGIIMPGRFLLGSRYYQEQAPGVAFDRAEHEASGLPLVVPRGSFTGCVFVHETSAISPDIESMKYYAPGVGLVKDGDLELEWSGFVDD